MDALQRLRDAGLIVKPSSTSGSFYIDKPGPKEDVTSRLRLEDASWFFEVLDFIPGPGLDDFQCEFAELDEAVEAVLVFYLDEPTIVDGWVIPFHRHPELRTDGIKQTIAKATCIAQDAFNEIEESHWNKIRHYQQHGQWEHYRQAWQYIVQHQFLKIPHVEDCTVTLRLRRDGQEGYIVRIA
jgi:glycosidase